jgi:MFS family permease
MLLPVARRLVTNAPGEGRRASVPAATGAAVGVATLTWAAQHPSLLAAGYGAAGLVLLVFALRALLPRGTVTARPGLPTVVAARALLSGSYTGMEAYLPLTMTTVHSYSPMLSGLPLTVTALGWSAASMVQGRHPEWSRETALRIGFGLVAVTMVSFALVSQPWFPAWTAFLGCAVGGAGMGIAYPSLSVLLLRFSPAPERGFNTSAMQLADWVSSAVTVGFGGVLLGVLASTRQPSPAMAALGACLAGIALLGVFVTRRWPTHE